MRFPIALSGVEESQIAWLSPPMVPNGAANRQSANTDIIRIKMVMIQLYGCDRSSVLITSLTVISVTPDSGRSGAALENELIDRG